MPVFWDVAPGGLVRNIILAATADDIPPPTDGGAIVPEPDETGGIGWTYINGTIAPPPESAPPPVVPVPVPASVTPYQARRALIVAGLYDLTELAVSEAPAEVRVAWEYGLEVRRDSPMIAAIASTLGLSPVDVDALFLAAATF